MAASSVHLEPFSIEVPSPVLDDLQDRLARTRWTDQLPGTGWDLGTDAAWLRRVVDFWRTDYDWRAAEASFNRYEQFLATVDGLTVHLLLSPSANPEATPLLLCHGWPGGITEFIEVVGPLADPADGSPGFNVVSASMPGYGFSGPTTETGVEVNRIAEAYVAIMGALGHDRFVASGGDWGSLVVRRLGEAHAEQVMGIHTTMCFGFPDPDDPNPMEGVTEAEAQALADSGARIAGGLGYMEIQSTRPQSLAYGHGDSPVGLAGWILEKFWVWSDHTGLTGDAAADGPIAWDALLTNLMTYWLTNTAGSAHRLYQQARQSGTSAMDPWAGRVEVPTGHPVFPFELLQTPRVWAEQHYDIVHWTEQPRGGHFAAMEVPDLFVADLLEFAKHFR